MKQQSAADEGKKEKGRERVVHHHHKSLSHVEYLKMANAKVQQKSAYEEAMRRTIQEVRRNSSIRGYFETQRKKRE